MDPLEEFHQLKETMRKLETRAQMLRDQFLQPGARLRSNRYEVVVKHQKRWVFQKDRLPPELLNDPRFWEETVSPVVTVRALGPREASDDDLQLIERFEGLVSAPRPFPPALTGSAGG